MMGTVRRRTVLAGLAATPAVLYLLLRDARRSPVPAAAPPHGPAGDFRWQGYEWDKRSWDGRPHYNGRWSPRNVVVRDDGSVVLRLTNSGRSPVAAEIVSTRTGWGYGTYSCTFEADFDDVGDAMVWGNLFTYDSTQQGDADSHNEIDAGEISAWGVRGGPTRITGVVWDEGPRHVKGHDVRLPRGLRFYRTSMTWTPQEVSFVTAAGPERPDGVIASSVVDGEVVPVPRNEQVHFNIWVTRESDADHPATPSFQVRLTSFTFRPFDPADGTDAEPEGQEGLATGAR